jgi:leucyl aminopeptidase (aminopeptidase T)
LSEAAKRGAENVIRHCLAVQPDERVVLLSWRTTTLIRLLEVACLEAGAKPVVIATDTQAGASDVERWVNQMLEGATASLLLAEHGVPPLLSMAVLDAAKKKSLRHLHLTRAETRLFEQSYRAEPQRIAELNERVRAVLAAATEVRARGDNGTDLRVGLSRALPLLSANGQPPAGRPDNLPSGFVFFHPGSVEGTIAADRGLLGAIRIGRDRLRTPVTFRIENGRVRDVGCDDAALRAEIDGYLSSHVHAARVGLVSLPTNYIVRTESGLDVQDALLPGLGLSLGYTDQENSRAPFACPVQLRILSRKLDVTAGGRALVRAGRLEADLVRDIDPFR